MGFIMGVFFGYILPRFYVGRLITVRKQKFNDQLMDAIMIMSSSFRGGLSLVQAFESVVDEMPEPAKGEFGVVLGENKMGVSLDESLNRLYVRMPSPAMQQMVTAILLARETGGNLPNYFYAHRQQHPRAQEDRKKSANPDGARENPGRCHDRFAGVFLFYRIRIKPAFF